MGDHFTCDGVTQRSCPPSEQGSLDNAHGVITETSLPHDYHVIDCPDRRGSQVPLKVGAVEQKLTNPYMETTLRWWRMVRA